MCDLSSKKINFTYYSFPLILLFQKKMKTHYHKFGLLIKQNHS